MLVYRFLCHIPNGPHRAARQLLSRPALALAFLLASPLLPGCVVTHDSGPDRHGSGNSDHAPVSPGDRTQKTTGSAQSTIVDATRMGSSIPLDHSWRVGIAPGDEPSKPSFDDSKWAARDAHQVLADVDDSLSGDETDKPSSEREKEWHLHPASRPFAWFRLHVQLPPQHGPLVVYVRLPVSRTSQYVIGSEAVGMDLFANGKLIVPEGANGISQESYQPISRVYPIDIANDETSLTLAIRIPYIPVGMDAYTNFFGGRTFFLGEKSDLRSHLELWQHAVLFERIPSLVDSGIKILLGLFLLVLFWTQKDHPEYLWLGLHLIAVAPLSFVEFLGTSAQLERLTSVTLEIQLLLISAYFYFEFLVSFLALRKRWYILAMRYSSPLLLTVAPLLLFVSHGNGIAIGLGASMLFAVFWLFAWLLFTAITLTVAAIRRNYEAALLLLPLLLSVVGLLELVSTAASSSWMGNPIQSPLSFQAGPVPIHFSAIADFAGIFVIILIVFVRFLRIHRERERASSELAAARSVQELMIPREPPLTPGFHVDTVYTPATEVGGDFFHIEPKPGGGLLIVVGDVAGHGLQAAMNVSMLMGALRRSPLSEPAKLLAGLNQVLVGSASFTTCQAAYFHPNGELVIASAGHPPPYLNSQEIELPGGLPLGVVAGVVYEETHLYLHPGDRLLMMSDGVAEARKPNGELFGFDRVRNLSAQSAFFIADAAKEFGQEDDITVLTIRRLVQAAAA